MNCTIIKFPKSGANFQISKFENTFSINIKLKF
jgi:hypothetical protein